MYAGKAGNILRVGIINYAVVWKSVSFERYELNCKTNYSMYADKSDYVISY